MGIWLDSFNIFCDRTEGSMASVTNDRDAAIPTSPQKVEHKKKKKKILIIFFFFGMIFK